MSSSSRAAGPSPSEVLKDLEQFAAGATHSVDDPGASSTVAPARSGGALQPGPAPSSSVGNGGGYGTPLRGFGPDSWPQMPADTSYLGLFPQLSAAKVDPFFAGGAEPPAAPSFDPGSTPD